MRRPLASSTIRGPGEVHIGDKAVSCTKVDADNFRFVAFAEVDLKVPIELKKIFGWLCVLRD